MTNHELEIDEETDAVEGTGFWFFFAIPLFCLAAWAGIAYVVYLVVR